MDNQKEQTIDFAIAQIEKQFGKGSIMKMGKEISSNIKANVTIKIVIFKTSSTIVNGQGVYLIK